MEKIGRVLLRADGEVQILGKTGLRPGHTARLGHQEKPAGATLGQRRRQPGKQGRTLDPLQHQRHFPSRLTGIIGDKNHNRSAQHSPHIPSLTVRLQKAACIIITFPVGQWQLFFSPIRKILLQSRAKS